MDRDELRHHMKIQIGGMSIRQWCRLNKCNVSHVAAFLQGKKGPPGDMLRALNLRVDYVAISQQAEARAEGLVAALEKTQSLVAKCCPSGFKDEAAVRALYENNGAICDALTAYRSARP